MRRMASLVKLLLAFLVVMGILRGGYAEVCKALDISVSQSETAAWAHGYPVYDVMVSNGCSSCNQSSVLLHCAGFDTTFSVDPAVFRPTGDNISCVVNNYGPLANGTAIKFQYAWETKFDFAVLRSKVTCP